MDVFISFHEDAALLIYFSFEKHWLLIDVDWTMSVFKTWTDTALQTYTCTMYPG